MRQSLSSVYLHAIFSTKERVPFLRDKGVRQKLHSYLAGISSRLDCPALIVNGVEDHVHLLARQSRTISQADWIKELKRTSTRWLKQEQGAAFKDFAWQGGYGIFSVSASNLETVEEYIAKQEEHHRTKTFQEEFLSFLKKHRIDWDDQHVLD